MKLLFWMHRSLENYLQVVIGGLLSEQKDRLKPAAQD